MIIGKPLTLVYSLKKDNSKQRWRPTHYQPVPGSKIVGNVDRKKYHENRHDYSLAHFFASRPLFSLVFTDPEPGTG